MQLSVLYLQSPYILPLAQGLKNTSTHIDLHIHVSFCKHYGLKFVCLSLCVGTQEIYCYFLLIVFCFTCRSTPFQMYTTIPKAPC